jgi:adenosylmethionine-8-amino-7-oxononanoate aminotransferase
MSYILHRSLRKDLPVAVRAEGIWVQAADGKRYIDAGLAPATCALGHTHPKVVQAVQRQVAELHFAHMSRFSNAPAEALAERLVTQAPPGFARAYFSLSGADAVEAALKLARQYAIEIGQAERSRFIARRYDFHGVTAGALSVSDRPERTRFAEGLMLDVRKVSCAYPYRFQRPDETEEAYGQRLADELEATLQELGPETVAGFIVETMNGTGLGMVAPPKGYFPAVREICDRHGVLLILDEVLCGLGYTGTMHAFEQEGVVPDMVIVGKGLGAGYQPMSAVILGDAIVDGIAQGSGSFGHSQTYEAHAVGCAAALAIQEVIDEEGLLEQVVAKGELVDSLLRERLGDHPNVGDIRGRGLLRAVEFVQDRSTKAFFDRRLNMAERVRTDAFDHGLACFAWGGQIEGQGDHVVVSPPFITPEADIEAIVDVLVSAVDKTFAAV